MTKNAKKPAGKKPTMANPKKAVLADNKPAVTDKLLSVSDVARELGIDPKRARAAMRAAGRGNDGARYSMVARGSDEHTALLLFFEGNEDGVDSAPR